MVKKEIRKVIAGAMVAFMTILPTQAFAAGSETEVSSESTVSTVESQAGITPDSILYSLDKLMEKVQLLVTGNPVEKVKLLDSIASERLDESEEMAAEDKLELAQKALEAYKEALTEASNAIEQAIEAGEDVEGAVDQLSESIDNQSPVIEDTEDQQDSEEVQETEDPAEEAADAEEDANDTEEASQSIPVKKQITQTVLAAEIGDQAVMDKMVQAGLNTRQILAVKALSDLSDKPLSDVLDTFLQNRGLGSTAKALGLSPKDALKAINLVFKKNITLIKVEFNNAKTADSSTEENQDTGDISAQPTESETQTETEIEQPDTEVSPTPAAHEDGESAKVDKEKVKTNGKATAPGQIKKNTKKHTPTLPAQASNGKKNGNGNGNNK